MNISKVSTVIIKDADGNIVRRFELGIAGLRKSKGMPDTLELTEAKKK